MKALVYGGPGRKDWTEVPVQVIRRGTDAIVKMSATTVCGTDLHILGGDVPQVEPGRILGHDGVGVITEAGDGAGSLHVGDRVIVSCISSCGRCTNCRSRLFSHCLDVEGGAGLGWILGHAINGTRAEYVRAPFAETSLHPVPETVTDGEAILLSDILPTGFEIGV